MSRSKLLLLICAVVCGFIVISIRNRLSEAPTVEVATADAAPSRVMIAKRDLAPGIFVQGLQDLDWQVAAADTPQEGVLREGNVRVEDFNGAVVRRPLRAGEVVPATAMMKAGEGGFMSAVLEPGMLAVSIAVTATSGNAGFITPGDRVDLIVTHRVKMVTGADNNNVEESVVSETFVRDVRVLAVDQMLDNPENKAILAKTVTVEVDSRKAEQVAVAAEMGKVTLALRSIGKEQLADATTNPINELYGETSENDVSQVLGQRSNFSARVRVIRGDQSENIQFNRGNQ